MKRTTRHSQYNLEATIAWDRRFNTAYDMDHALEHVIKGEKVVILWGGKRRTAIISYVVNQGFNGQVAMFKFADKTHGQMQVKNLPQSFHKRMIDKFRAAK